MKKALCFFSVLMLCILLGSCNTDPVHEHIFERQWTYDNENHWHVAVCEHAGEVADLASHLFGPETEEANGMISKTCTICGYKSIYNPGTVKLTLVLNNGEPSQIMKRNPAEEVVLASNPVKHGYGITSKSLYAPCDYPLAYWMKEDGTKILPGGKYTFTEKDETLYAVYCVSAAIVNGDAHSGLFSEYFDGTADYSGINLEALGETISALDILDAVYVVPSSGFEVPEACIREGYHFADTAGNLYGPSYKSGNSDFLLLRIPNAVTVTCKANSGSGTDLVRIVPYGYSVSIGKGAAFEKDGYILAGWNTAADGTASAYAQTGAFSADTVLFAQWLKLHTITYDANGGEGTMDSLCDVDERADVTLATNAFTRTDYLFTGWNTASDGTGTSYADGYTGKFNSDMTLYAQWFKLHTITYDANGGTGTMEPMTNLDEREFTVLASNKFLRTSYLFTGWNTAADGTGTSYAEGYIGKFNFDMTLYAQWFKLHTITYDANGGEGTMDSLCDVDEREDVTLDSNAFTRTSYLFTGWNTASDGTGTSYADGYTGKFNSDMTLYAQWFKLHTITYDANGGEGTMDSLCDVDEREDVTLTANAFTRTSYLFTGWNSASDGTGTSYADGYTGKFNSDVTLYAQWLKLHTITYDANGGEGTMDSLCDVDERTDVTLASNAFTRNGYIFTGWNTASDGTGTSYADGYTGKFNSDVTLYAQWVPTCTVTYISNGGTGSMNESKVGENTDFTLPKSGFTRTGYRLKNWNTKADGTGTSYADGGTCKFNSDVTLYAQWTKVGTTGPAGGVIFYDCDEDNILGNADGLTSATCGWRFLEASISENAYIFGYYRASPNGADMYVNGTTTYTEGTSDPDDGLCTGTAIGTGKANTAKLINAMNGSAYAEGIVIENFTAKMADAFTYGGYSDWFLPSRDELLAIWNNLSGIEGISMITRWHWSSSEDPKNPQNAYNISMNNGNVACNERDYRFNSFFVRSFI